MQKNPTKKKDHFIRNNFSLRGYVNKFYLIPLCTKIRMYVQVFFCVSHSMSQTPKTTGNDRRQQVTMLTFSYIFFLLQSLSNSRLKLWSQVIHYIHYYYRENTMIYKDTVYAIKYQIIKLTLKYFLKMFCRCLGTC